MLNYKMNQINNLFRKIEFPKLSTYFILFLLIISGNNLMAQDDYQINGKIKIDSLTLASFNNEFGANSIDMELKLEVWNITYRAVKVNQQDVMRVYFNEKIESPIIERNYKLEDNSVEVIYTIKNIPTEEDYVLLYYFNKMPSDINYSKLESKLYLDANSKSLRHSTNVRHKLSSDIKYGAIYLDPNNLEEQELSVSSLKQIPIATFSFNIGDVWNDVGDFFSDAADMVWEGGKSFAGVIVSASGSILFQGYGITKEAVLNGKIAKYRKITTREYNFANKYLFGGTLPSRSKILISNLLGAGNREFVWPSGTGHFLMSMGKPGYSDALYDESKFMHELAHVWQLHVTDDIKWTIEGITTQIKNSTTDEDAYSVNCADNWGSMNLEQQATVAENCFDQRKIGVFGGCYEDNVIKYIRNGNGFPTAIDRSIESLAYDQGWRVEKHPRMIGDINGDGRDDIIGFGDEKVFVELGQANGTFISAPRTLKNLCYVQGWRVEKHPRMIGDINGDGRDDLIGFGDEKVFVELGQANGTFISAPRTLNSLCYVQGWRVEKHPRMIGDINGDGRDDLIGFGASKVFVQLGQSNGTFVSAPGTLNSLCYDKGWRIEKHPRMIGDINGDGRDDLIGFGDEKVFVELGQANGTFISAPRTLNSLCYVQGWRVEKHPRMIGDINGDGRDDLIGFGASKVFVQLGQSNGTFVSAPGTLNSLCYDKGWRVEKHPRMIGDINGDGRDDIIGFGANKIFVQLGQANGRLVSASQMFNNLSYAQNWRVEKHPRMIGDINSDGRDDVIGFGRAAIYFVNGNRLH